MAASRVIAAALLLLPGACVVPYQPLRLEVPLPADAFLRCCEVVRGGHGNLAVADAAAFRLQSQWVGCQLGEFAARRRATVFRLDDGALGVVVERQLLDSSLLGEPQWLAVQGDPAAERQLAAALAAVLQPPPR